VPFLEESINKKGAKMEYIQIKWTDDRFPKRLLKIKDCPRELYVMGNCELLNKVKTIAIIGSRDCTNYGRKTATHFAKELSKEDICIISGMAIGIDEAAHIGAIENIRKNNSCTGRRI